MIVYHGSTVEVDHPISAACRPNLDFGKGFYLTDIREQAERWACRATNRDKQQWLNIYSLDVDKVRKKYKSLRFSSYDDTWLDFIMACRKGEDVWAEYDFIEEGIADDRVFNTIDLYLQELISKEEALKRLSFEHPNNQFCVVSQIVLDQELHFIEALSLRSDLVFNRKINANESLLQMKYARIVDGLIERLKVNRVHALDVFYMSETYRDLVDKKGDLHCMSDAYLIDEIVLELERNQGY
ncbi:DUF3990 domain-containing protein [Parabacteroides sp.]